jgi:hypothetical protein
MPGTNGNVSLGGELEVVLSYGDDTVLSHVGISGPVAAILQQQFCLEGLQQNKY